MTDVPEAARDRCRANLTALHTRSAANVGMTRSRSHGQVFKLKTKGAVGQPLWAYRYWLEGRGSVRPQVGGFATRAEAQRRRFVGSRPAGPGGGARMTLGKFVDEYLEMHTRPHRSRSGSCAGCSAGNRRSRRGPARRSLAEAGVRVASDAAGTAPLRGDAGAAPGPQPRARVVDRLQPIQPSACGCRLLGLASA